MKKQFKRIYGDRSVLTQDEKIYLGGFMKENKKKVYHYLSSREIDPALNCTLI